MEFLGIIPARYGSTRFPGKPLVDINGKTMIHHVYEKASEALTDVVVATDDQRIFDEVKSFGGNVVLTSPDHQSGTERCKEAFDIFSKKVNKDFKVIINVQGDEPFIKAEQINLLKKCFDDITTQIATLIKKVDSNEEIFNPNKPKVVINSNEEAIYFSRSPIPYIRNSNKENWDQKHIFFKHIGIYAYHIDALNEIVELPKSNLEEVESLEQLRWIENGYKIKVAETDFESISIDTKEDLEELLKHLN
jgi:3-deoxy-manno-octulosonate cytidylyltransferase (CMP-KDO synthetase)